MKRYRLYVLLMIFVFASLFAFQINASESKSERPNDWAEKITGKKGLKNFHKVSDILYRGEQPEDEGFQELKDMGIKTVVNLRTFHSDRENCEKVKIAYVHITAQAWEGDNEEVIDFLKVVTNEKRQPVFVHCQHGADRTGVMCAVYRIAVQGWSKEEAIKEMVEGDYGFHSVWQNLIDYVQNLDVEEIKKKAGIDL